MRTALTLAALLLAALPTRAAEIDRTKTALRETFDVAYHPDAGPRRLDVLAPPAKEGAKYPVVLWVHGGTWMAGDKDHRGISRNVGRMLAASGCLAVMVNYRLTPAVRHPGHVEDVARAYAWAVRNAAKYGGDPENVVLMGHSAGGHLVSLLAADASFFADKSLALTPKEIAGLKGVVSVSGVYRIPGADEFKKMADRIVPLMLGEGNSATTRLLSVSLLAASGGLNPFVHVFGSDRARQEKASPIAHVRKGMVPFLVLTAEEEVPGLFDMAVDFVAALKKVGVVVELKPIDDCNHRTIVHRLHKPDTDAGKAVLAFVSKVTGKS